MPVPEGFDYDTWLGPAPKAPYHKDRCLYRFRFIRDYSGGQTTNFGCHSNDVVQWAMGTDDTCPIEYEDTGSEFPPKGDLFNTPTKVAFRARYASGVVLECKTDPLNFGAKFEGTEGWLRVTANKIECQPQAIKDSTIGDRETPPLCEPESLPELPGLREVPQGTHRTRRDRPSYRRLCHLGNIAMLLKRKIKWDPVKEEIVGDAEAAGMLTRPLRAPWRYDMPLST